MQRVSEQRKKRKAGRRGMSRLDFKNATELLLKTVFGSHRPQTPPPVLPPGKIL